jgi:hypothetical protein
MNNYREKIVDAITGEISWRDYSLEEIAEIEKDLEQTAKERALREAKAQARQALLDKLGITEDEAKLLLGGN